MFAQTQKSAVVIDNGSGLIKTGLSGEKLPRFVYSNIIGRARAMSVMIGAGQKEYYIGDEAQAKRGILSIKYPVEHGVVTSWPDMELIWRNVYECDLRIQPSERPVLVTEVPLNPLCNREAMTQVLFECFRVPAMYVAIQSVLALYASGRTTGCVVDCGAGVTNTVPIFEGYCMPRAVLRQDVAGHDLTDYLMHILSEIGVSLVSTSEREIVQDIKERLCYVAVDIGMEMCKRPCEIEKDYRLPDGNVIMVYNQRYRCPEILFSPANTGQGTPGIHELCNNTIQRCDIDLRQCLYCNIILSGGSSLFPGMHERLTKEVCNLVPCDTTVKVFAPVDRKLSVWMGASILSSLSAFQQMWVTAFEYKEVGPNIVHRKCF
ncbi:actin-1-like [Lissotriton helveticus]